MTEHYAMEHPQVQALAESLEDVGVFTAAILRNIGVRKGIAHALLNSGWFQEYTRRVAEKAWAEGNDTGWRDAAEAEETDGVETENPYKEGT